MQPDKILHMKGGAVAALFAIAVAALLLLVLGLQPLTAAVATAALAVGFGIEGAQWGDNRLSASDAPKREVSLADAMVTAAPGLALAAGFEAGHRAGLW